jgi:hypothetical protein
MIGWRMPMIPERWFKMDLKLSRKDERMHAQEAF